MKLYLQTLAADFLENSDENPANLVLPQGLKVWRWLSPPCVGNDTNSSISQEIYWCLAASTLSPHKAAVHVSCCGEKKKKALKIIHYLFHDKNASRHVWNPSSTAMKV